MTEIRQLLGANVDDLKTYENETIIRDWIQGQSQSDLDALNIGLTGGQRNTDTAVGTTSPAKTTPDNETTVGTTSPANTTSGGATLAITATTSGKMSAQMTFHKSELMMLMSRSPWIAHLPNCTIRIAVIVIVITLYQCETFLRL